MRTLKIISLGFGVLFMFHSLGQDTTRVLRSVPVFAHPDTITALSDLTASIPHFEISAAKIDEIGATDVGGALKIIPGVQMRDYGGIGGVKTISFRSLGAAHTTVVLDGNTIPNLRSGSINLSQFELFGLEKVSFSSGQVLDELATASAFVQANTIALRSTLFTPPQKSQLGVYLNGTSINAYEGGLRYQRRLGKQFFIGTQVMTRWGNGQYNFIHPEWPEGEPSRRTNTQLNSWRNRWVVGYENDKSRFILSAFLNRTNQELPGAAVLFNPSNDQRLETNNARFNGNYSFDKLKWSVRLNMSHHYRETRYFDPHFLNLQGFVDAQYQQHTTKGGVMLSRSFRFPKEKLFIGADWIVGNLSGNELITSPNRMTAVSVLGGTTFLGPIKVEGNLTAQFIVDQYAAGDDIGQNRFQKFSPFLAVVYKPFKKSTLRLRSFYKHTFRMPTFNDLYYNFIGNTGLKPEEANMFNLGLTWAHARKNLRLELTADGYYNKVTDKIVAIPTKDLFNWSMQNIGAAEIHGVDLGLLLAIQFKRIGLHLNSSHSLNRSLDVTDPSAITYQHQIPYTPFYTSTNGISLTYKTYKVSLNTLVTGFRYSLNENIYANYLPGFTDINAGLSKTINWKKSTFLIDARVMNILNNNYQVIRSFPMPGRYFQLRLKYGFKK